MKYNIYCDESCHLEHDSETIMIIGGIKIPTSIRKRVRGDILDIKNKYGIPPYAEIKWNKVANCNIDYFKSLVDYFFDNEEMSFRAIVVDKTKLNHKKYNQTHDEFYYKMYFHCLSGLVETQDENYIYLDKKDTKGSYRISRLHFYLSQKTHDFDQSRIKRIQCVNSRELPVIQLTDLLIGAVGYKNRDIPLRSEAKSELVEYISKRSKYQLTKSTFLSEKKFNLFFIDLQA
ncbi:MAG: DUF3800 domain-containing protein [Eubacterium sp.]|nr:DUF3800 domain-containing protein [Eubacterium sp.]